jgi:hypothetical protein
MAIKSAREEMRELIEEVRPRGREKLLKVWERI